MLIGDKPLVSVYMATKDRCQKLKRSVNSVLSQTHVNIELCIVNDASVDDTHSYLEALTSIDSRVNFVSLAVSQGACSARNRAIQLCSGDFLTGLDDDDYFLPTRVSEFVASYDPKYSFLCAHQKLFGGFPAKMSLLPKEIDLHSLKCRNLVGNQIFVERGRIEEVGGYDETFKSWQDYDLWFRLVHNFGTALKLPYESCVVDQSNDTTRISSSVEAKQGYYQFVGKHKDDLTDLDVYHLLLADHHNRNVKISLMDIATNTKSLYGFYRLLSLFAKSYFRAVFTSNFRDSANLK